MKNFLSPAQSISDHPLFNAVWFNILWLTAVILQNSSVPILLFMICIHFISITSQWRTEALRAAGITASGMIIDSSLTAAGVLSFEDHTVIPLWLVLLWAGFATTPARSLRWLPAFPRLMPVLGGIAGCSSYYAGYRLGAVSFPMDIPLTLLLLFCLWALIVPMVFRFNRHLIQHHA